MKYHAKIEARLMDYPDLTAALSDLPEALETFTDKTAVMSAVTDLLLHIIANCLSYEEGERRTIATRNPTPAPPTLSGSSSSHQPRTPKVAQPTCFEGATTAARTFLMWQKQGDVSPAT